MSACSTVGDYPAVSAEGAKPVLNAILRYQLLANVQHVHSRVDELEIKTFMSGCRATGRPNTANEQIELFGPDGKQITVLDKAPYFKGDGNYEGRFVIELPPSAPTGEYRLVTTFGIDGQLCAKSYGRVLRKRHIDK